MTAVQNTVSFEKLDRAILARVRANAPARFSDINGGEVRRELELVANATGRQDHMVLEGRLQALKKAGQLVFADGWKISQ